MHPQKNIFMAEHEYLKFERNSEIKHQYFNGELFAMTGASRKHNLVVANVIGELRNLLKNKPCRVYPSDMRVKVEKDKLYTYPDVVVVCGDEQFGDDELDTLLNPNVIIEVLSDSTESYDRGKKFASYRKISSLKEYIIISQHEQKIERFFIDKDSRWALEETCEGRPSVTLETIECELLLSEVYDKIDDF